MGMRDEVLEMGLLIRRRRNLVLPTVTCDKSHIVCDTLSSPNTSLCSTHVIMESSHPGLNDGVSEEVCTIFIQPYMVVTLTLFTVNQKIAQFLSLLQPGMAPHLL